MIHHTHNMYDAYIYIMMHIYIYNDEYIYIYICIYGKASKLVLNRFEHHPETDLPESMYSDCYCDSFNLQPSYN